METSIRVLTIVLYIAVGWSLGDLVGTLKTYRQFIRDKKQHQELMEELERSSLKPYWTEESEW